MQGIGSFFHKNVCLNNNENGYGKSIVQFLTRGKNQYPSSFWMSLALYPLIFCSHLFYYKKQTVLLSIVKTLIYL